MVLRMFSACDNAAMRVASGSPSGSSGTPIANNSSTADGTVFEFTGGFQDHVISLNDTSANTEVFEDDAAGNHVIIDGKGIVPDETPVESESLIYLRQLDEFGNETGPTITLTMFSQNGNYWDVWGFASDTPLQDGAQYVKTGGSNTGDSAYMDFAPSVVVACFAAGTRIASPRGPRAVEDLRAGDEVLTADHDRQTIRWAAATHVALARSPQHRPILIQAHALGAGRPERDLIVSPQHRILVNCDGKAVFVPAKALTELRNVREMKGRRSVEYVHVLLDPHAILLSEGLATESFFPGTMGRAALGRAQARDLDRVLQSTGPLDRLCRPSLRRQEAAAWARRMRDHPQQTLGYGAEIFPHFAISA